MNIPMHILNDGVSMPVLGLGTYQLDGEDGLNSILAGLELGYRLLDTAVNYENEDVVGEALRRTAVPRDEIFITTKLPGRFHAYGLALASVEESARKLGVDCIDQVLIHWPNPKVGLYAEAWKALIESQRRGIVRSIGVSNFLPEQVERIFETSGVLYCNIQTLYMLLLYI